MKFIFLFIILLIYYINCYNLQVCPFLFSSRIASPGCLYLYGDGTRERENEFGNGSKEKEKKKKFGNTKRRECFCGEDFGKRLLKLLEGKISIRTFRRDLKKRNLNEND
jgi:hypothetical protein